MDTMVSRFITMLRLLEMTLAKASMVPVRIDD
jgi:hypothetical protein